MPCIFQNTDSQPSDGRKLLTLLPMPPRCNPEYVKVCHLTCNGQPIVGFPIPQACPNAGVEHAPDADLTHIFCPFCFSMALIILALVFSDITSPAPSNKVHTPQNLLVFARSTTILYPPRSLVPCSSRTHADTWLSVAMATNPKPLQRPLMGSRTILISVTRP